VVTYLTNSGARVCSIQAAVNQHLGGQIEICDAFWPYEKMRPSANLISPGGYVEQRGDYSAPGAA
jgi:hypothetical protein